MSEWKLTDIFKPFTAIFQPTSTYDNKLDDKSLGDEPQVYNNPIYCEYGGTMEPKTHPAVEWFIRQVAERKKAIAEKSPDQFPELEEALMEQFTHFMRYKFGLTVDKTDNLLRAMEKSRISAGIPLKDIVATTDNKKVHIFEENQNIDNLAAQLDSKVEYIVEEHFGKKDAGDLKDISMGNYLLNHVRSRCLEEANSKEHNIPVTDVTQNSVAVPNVPLVRTNNTASMP